MKFIQIFIISFFILVNSISSGLCQDISLSWDASPTAGVTGYKVYYKQGNGDLPFDGIGANEGTSPVDVNNSLSTTLTGLEDGTTYFFTITAYDNDNGNSSYSNIVSNGWLPTLLIPTDGATGVPIPTTMQWETAPNDYDVAYTLFYGTDRDDVTTAALVIPQPVPTAKTDPPTKTIFILSALILILISGIRLPKIKKQLQNVTLLTIILLGGFLTACSSEGGGGGSSSSGSSAVAEEPLPSGAALYSINKGGSDYHQAFDLDEGTTYFWKVVATDTLDPNLTYESEVRQFTTDTF